VRICLSKVPYPKYLTLMLNHVTSLAGVRGFACGSATDVVAIVRWISEDGLEGTTETCGLDFFVEEDCPVHLAMWPFVYLYVASLF